MTTPLTEAEIEELFRQLNMIVPALVNYPILTPFDCDSIREAFATAGLARTRKAEILAAFLSRAHDLGVPDSFLGMIADSAEVLAGTEEYIEGLQASYNLSSAVPEPEPPTALELMASLRVHPDLMRRLHQLLLREFNFLDPETCSCGTCIRCA